MSAVETQSFDTAYASYSRAVASRQKELVFVLGVALLTLHKTRLRANHVWDVLEQVASAAAEFGHDEWYKYCADKLKSKFPGSSRVRRMQAAALDANEHFGGALGILSEVLKANSCDVNTRRRIITMTRSQNGLAECVDMLNRHLDEFATDTQAWQELGDIYMSNLQLQQALYCYEETLIHAESVNAHGLLTVAQLLYSLGAPLFSRKYFAGAAQLEDSPRALWGILMCNAQTTATPPAHLKRHTRSEGPCDRILRKGSPASEASLTLSLSDVIGQRLLTMYGSSDSSSLPEEKSIVTFRSVSLQVVKQLAKTDGCKT